MQGKIFDNSTFLNLYYDKNFQKKELKIKAKTGRIEIDGEKMLYAHCLTKRNDLKLHPYFTFLLYTKQNPASNKVKLKFDIAGKIRGTHLINGTILIGKAKILFDVFISKEKQGIMINEQFYDLSKGNTLFLRETNRRFIIKQIRFRKNMV